jgi:periplasmic protein TonB
MRRIMKAMGLRSGSPAHWQDMRLGLALVASLVLHAAILLPFGPVSRPLPERPGPLRASLTAPELATQIEEAVAVPIEEAPLEQLAAVPSAPTFSPVAPKPQARPKPLAGAALNTALAALASEEFYPREAIAQGLEGRVVLLLTLTEAGRVAAAEVASSSGHALLDAAAQAAAGRIGVLPGGDRQVLLPVEFRLE